MKAKSLLAVLALLCFGAGGLFGLSSCARRGRATPPSGLVIKADGNDLLSQPHKPVGAYTPAMSRVPGFPIELSYPNAKITVTVDRGGILFWGADTGERVLEKGKSVTVGDPCTLYWTPLEGDNTDVSSPTKAVMNIDFITSGRCAYAEIEFNLESNNFYSAMLTSWTTNDI